MIKPTVFQKIVFLGVAIAFVTNSIKAIEVNYAYSGETGGGLVMGLDAYGDYGNFLVGQVVMTTSTPGFSTLNSYCTDVGVDMASSSMYTPYAMTAAQATGVNPKWVAGGGVAAATLWANYSGAVSGVTQMAGLQLAIWELLNNHLGAYTANNFYSSQNGGFSVTSTDANSEAAVGFAVSILDAMNNITPEQNVLWLAPVEADGSIGGSQGLLEQGPGSNTTSVPDGASTLFLLGLALFAIGLWGRGSAVMTAIRQARKPAYLKIRREVRGRRAVR